jgi:FtsH-binding integral membrane protein
VSPNSPTTVGTPDELGLPQVSINAGTILAITNTILFIAGALAVVFIIVGGIQYATAAGNPQRAAKARSTLLFAVIGLVIALLARALINFALDVPS